MYCLQHLWFGCFFVLCMRARGTPNKNKLSYRWVVRHLRMGQNYPTCDKTMNVSENHSTKTYLNTSRASSCKCTRIVGCAIISESLARFLRKILVILWSHVGKGLYYGNRGSVSLCLWSLYRIWYDSVSTLASTWHLVSRDRKWKQIDHIASQLWCRCLRAAQGM